MPHQQALFDPPTNHTPTSDQAADEIRRHVGRLHRIIHAFIRWRNGATDQEICEGLALRGDTVRPRRRELVLRGYVAKSCRLRRTSSGRPAAVWQVTEKPLPPRKDPQ